MINRRSARGLRLIIMAILVPPAFINITAASEIKILTGFLEIGYDNHGSEGERSTYEGSIRLNSKAFFGSPRFAASPSNVCFTTSRDGMPLVLSRHVVGFDIAGGVDWQEQGKPCSVLSLSPAILASHIVKDVAGSLNLERSCPIPEPLDLLACAPPPSPVCSSANYRLHERREQNIPLTSLTVSLNRGFPR